MKRDERLALRIDGKLKKEIQKHAKARGVTLSALVEAYFRRLLQEQNSDIDDIPQV